MSRCDKTDKNINIIEPVIKPRKPNCVSPFLFMLFFRHIAVGALGVLLNHHAAYHIHPLNPLSPLGGIFGVYIKMVFV